jgi:glycosyltransferase involved in cell wall biosynthesis
VVDDASHDDSAARAARHPGVRVLAGGGGTVPGGPAAARNVALAATSGRFVAPLDADDRWPAGRLVRLLGYLDSHPGCGVVVGHQEVVLEAGVGRPTWVDEPADWIPFDARVGLGPQIQPLAMLARRSVFDLVGGFDPDLEVCEDLDWFVRAVEAGVVVDVIDDVVVQRRIHHHNLSHDRDRMNRGALAVLRRKIERGRHRLR